MLAGVSVNDAILLVDAAQRFIAQGVERRRALAQAASLRLRPIVMTTCTTVLALVPLAIGSGEAAQLRSPMALTVIGGLIVATFGSLSVTPCLYLVLDRMRSRVPGACSGLGRTHDRQSVRVARPPADGDVDGVRRARAARRVRVVSDSGRAAAGALRRAALGASSGAGAREPEVVEREILLPLVARVGELAGLKETWGEVNGANGRLTLEFERGTNHRVRELELRSIAAELQRTQPRGHVHQRVVERPGRVQPLRDDRSR